MLYVGSFTFTGAELEDANDAQDGYFTCICEAADAEAALEKFEALIDSISEDDDLFDGTSDVFLESCAEIKEIPNSGMLTFWAGTSAEPGAMISTGIRGATEEQASTFFLGPDETGDDDETPSDEPFMSFHD